MARYEDTLHAVRGTKLHNFASIAAGAVSAAAEVPVIGAKVGDVVVGVSMNVSMGGCTFLTPVITATGIASVIAQNTTGGAVDIAEGTITVLVAK
ncbi:MAG: hypothetical protein V4629_03055 [Pseudomonadota bacterium]